MVRVKNRSVFAQHSKRVDRGQMKALLVQSPPHRLVPRRQWEPPSVAMATIAGQIENHDVRVVDMVVWRKNAVPRFLELLRTFKPMLWASAP